jgi:hypothetical protein
MAAPQWSFRSQSSATSAHSSPRRTRNVGAHSNTNTTPLPLGDFQHRSSEGSFEDFARDRFIIGDRVLAKEEIARYRELLGVGHFIMSCQWPGLPQERTLSTICRLGDMFAS